MKAIILVIGLASANFLTQLITGKRDWLAAADRTFFQAVAIGAYLYLIS